VLPLRVTRGEHCATLLAEQIHDQAMYQLHMLPALPLMVNKVTTETY